MQCFLLKKIYIYLNISRPVFREQVEELGAEVKVVFGDRYGLCFARSGVRRRPPRSAAAWKYFSPPFPSVQNYKLHASERPLTVGVCGRTVLSKCLVSLLVYRLLLLCATLDRLQCLFCLWWKSSYFFQFDSWRAFPVGVPDCKPQSLAQGGSERLSGGTVVKVRRR